MKTRLTKALTKNIVIYCMFIYFYAPILIIYKAIIGIIAIPFLIMYGVSYLMVKTLHTIDLKIGLVPLVTTLLNPRATYKKTHKHIKNQ